MSFPNVKFGPNGEQFANTSSARHPLGTQLILQDGRKFRYGQAGGTALDRAVLTQATVPLVGVTTMALTSNVGVGGRVLTMVTSGISNDTTYAADEFAGGYCIIQRNATAGGRIHLIDASDRMATTSSAFSITLAPGEGVGEALVAGTNTVGIFRHPYKRAIIHPSPPTAKLLGWTPTSIPVDRYGWFATAGVVAGLVDGTVVIADPVKASTGVNGAVGPQLAPSTAPDVDEYLCVAQVLFPAGGTTGIALLHGMLDN